jgi:hypothetical protein
MVLWGRRRGLGSEDMLVPIGRRRLGRCGLSLVILGLRIGRTNGRGLFLEGHGGDVLGRIAIALHLPLLTLILLL